jgi:L-ascorbate metabolism protein UlaG (beta-lactamase superfamily)
MKPLPLNRRQGGASKVPGFAESIAMRIVILASLLGILTSAAAHEDAATARYLANEGVLVAHGETRVLFDPLFTESFGEYRLPPEDLRLALMEGRPPWDGIDAVFISHYHDDHFAPSEVADYLRAQPAVRLYAPAQAATALRAAIGDEKVLLERVTAVSLAYGDPPRRFDLPGLAIEAIRVPHSGWPSRMLEVENLAWRITLDGGPTVLHLGDADTSDAHFARDREFWRRRELHFAMPPYWYFLSSEGRMVLEERLRPQQAVGIHVPVSIPENPDEREAALSEADLFTQPGETRAIPHRHREPAGDGDRGARPW